MIELADKLSPNAIKLIEGRNFAHLATIMPDGFPHVTPMWIDHEGDLILMNTAEGRVKLRNIRRDPRVAISIADQNNPYDRIVIQGNVIAHSTQGAEEHIDKLANKYTGAKRYERSSPTEKRVIIKVQPLKIL